MIRDGFSGMGTSQVELQGVIQVESGEEDYLLESLVEHLDDREQNGKGTADATLTAGGEPLPQ